MQLGLSAPEITAASVSVGGAAECDRVWPALLVLASSSPAAHGLRAVAASPPGQFLGPAKPGSASARTSWRIRSGLKFRHSTLSPGRIRPSSPTSVGVMNSSVSPRAYASRAAAGRPGVVLARPWTSRS